MKKLFLATLIYFLTGIALAQQVRPIDRYDNYDEFVDAVKKTVDVKRFHKIGIEEEIVLKSNQATLLELKDNLTGVEEFIIFYNGETVYLAYSFDDETKGSYMGTRLYPEKPKAYRGIKGTGAQKVLWLFYEYQSREDTAFVKFRTTLSRTENDRKQMKEIDQARSRRAAANTKEAVIAKLSKKISQEIPYEFGTVQKVTIVPDKKAVRLKCGDNPEGVKEILIGANSKHLFIYCIRTDGSISGGGSTWKEGPGSFRQVGASVAIGMWQRKDEKINVRFQLTDEDNTIVQSYKELEKAGKSFPKGRFSQSVNWNTLLDDPELLFPRLTQAQRVEGFTRLWSTVKFNFANFDLVPELNWDDVLSEYLPKVMADQSNGAYSLLLQECIARLRDGHTSVSTSGGNGLPTASPPLRIRSVGGKAIVTKLAETEEIKVSGINPGDEITHVDGRPVQELLGKDIYPYICASTDQGRNLKAYPRILQGPKESKVSLSIKTLEGATRKVSLTRKARGLAMIPRQIRRSDFEYRDLENGLAYVALNTFGSKDVVKAFKEKFKTIRGKKGLIIDVRENGGGSSSNGDAIIRCLIEKAIPHTLWKTPQHIAAFKAWGRPKKWFEGEPRMIEPKGDKPFLGPIVVLIGPGTNSAAEDFVVPLHAAGRAIIVGQKSRGSTGQPLQFSFLDGKIRGRVCTKRDTYPDSREFVGVGIIPDVEVNPTPADIIADRDVVLEKGLDILKSKLM